MESMLLKILKSEIVRLRRDEGGVALMMTLSVILLLYVVCAGVYAVGETVREKIELQSACDSAAYSAALVQADGLSRMAMVNRAMSWTYVQLVNMQIDYITYKWLDLVRRRFEQDKIRCIDFNSGSRAKHDSLGILCSCHECSNGNFTNPGTGWFCGVVGYGLDSVRLNGQPVTIAAIQSACNEVGGNISVYEANIPAMKQLIGSYNIYLENINANMQRSIPNTAMAVLMANLPKSSDDRSQIDSELAKDFFGYVDFKYAENPYNLTTNATFSAGGMDFEITGTATNTYFSCLRNTELDERLFLTMADGEVYDGIHDYFGYSGSGEKRFGGLDQWFVRSDGSDTVQSDEVEINKMKIMAGICRSYKNANRVSLNGIRLPAYRANHMNVGSDDNMPSCINTREYCPDQCHTVSDSIAPYAEYEWSSGHYRLDGFHMDVRTRRGKSCSIHYHTYNISYLRNCSLHGNGSAGSHTRRLYRSCFSRGQFTRIPLIDWEWPIGGLPVMFLECNGTIKGLGSLLSALNAVGSLVGYRFTDQDYGQTEDYARYTNSMRPNGFSRIYGDDIEICNESTAEYYTGVVAMPWILNADFYDGAGTITVGLARKQRNPWAMLLNAVEDVIDEDISDGSGIYSAFNPVEKGYITAFSAARAAHRYHPSKWSLAVAPNMSIAGIGEYETRYDAVCDDDDPAKKFGKKDGYRFIMENDNDGLLDLRIGCICNEDGEHAENIERFARCWNLCETDWDATLLPLRYSNSGLDSEYYDSFAHDLRSDDRKIGNVVLKRDGYNPNAFEEAMVEGDVWVQFVDAGGNAIDEFYDEKGQLKRWLTGVPGREILQMNEPFTTLGIGVETVESPYGTIDVESALQLKYNRKSNVRGLIYRRIL